MQEVKVGRRWCRFPSEWNELSKKQLLKIAPLLMKQDPELNDRVNIFRICTGLNWFWWQFVDADQVNELLYLTDFLYEGVKLTKNPITAFRGLHGPVDSFANLKGKEAAFSDAFFGQYDTFLSPTGDNLKALNSLVAVLYREGRLLYSKEYNRHGDIRKPFNSHTLPWHEKKVASWPVAVKLVIYLWYAGCTAEMVEQNKRVFEGAGDPSVYGMWSVMRSVALSGAHGSMEKVEDMYFPELLMELNESIIEADKIPKKK